MTTLHICRWPPGLLGILAGVSLGLAVSAARTEGLASPKITFNRDIRPILAAHCLRCHGPDPGARKADLRLDDEAGAHKDRGGYRAVVPGKPEESELFRRVTAHEEAGRMPPGKTPRPSAAEVALLRRWIEEGARYEKHWAFLPPIQRAVPNVRMTSWPRGPVDHFVLARLEAEGLAPAPEADRATLVRRVTLDLTGLPPTPGEVDDFLADALPGAYERVVERLLASPHYGERMALEWLDAARYADSGGYQGDIFRTPWPWRDWVITAFNRNRPFDQFTVEQVAGDLLPCATRDQRLATGFNRNHRINDEDGIIPEEFRVEYVVDRVETTAGVWLGLTMGCARCHSHKYDPISQKEFYRFFAFFNSVAEEGRGHGNAAPVLTMPSAEQERQITDLDRRIHALQGDLQRLPAGTASSGRREEMGRTLQGMQKQREEVVHAAPATMVMQDLDRSRDTFVLVRGAYDRHGEKVTAGVPEALPPLPPGAPANRLGLARWLVDAGNPLTARVAVNRFWQMYFGTGLVATPEDFGTQGEAPSHPELLDWLAVEFVRSGWDVKAMQRKIVTSATYRQSSRGSAELYRRDPHNRLLARRFGSPPVRPYQPEGLWKELAAVNLDYEPSRGPDLYRRSLYTFWRRTVPPPAMAAFDAPNRETCAVRRPRTNTPLQALVLMNDPTFVEAARVLGERILREGGPDAAARLTLAFRLVLARRPSPRELGVLQETLAFYRLRYARDAAAAQQFVRVGQSDARPGPDPGELAAYAAVAGVLLNLDEAVTKE
jgi:hypothetical protein